MINDIIEEFNRLFMGNTLYEAIMESDDLVTNAALRVMVPVIGAARVSKAPPR